MKRLLRPIIRRFGYDIVQAGFRWTVMDFLADREIELVLDVGANEGQFGRMLRKEGYQGRIQSFEPVASAFRVLSDAAHNDPNWDVHNFALGSVAGRATINVSEFTPFSSMLRTTGAASKFDSKAMLKHTEEIEVRTLDEVCPKIPERTFLKIDTQGFEKEVLGGARAILPTLKGIFMELPIIQLYEGNWQFHEAIAFMARAGFVPAQIHPVNYHSKDKMSLVDVDCLFRPYHSQLDE
jgi:FkbM family methyltransferase